MKESGGSGKVEGMGGCGGEGACGVSSITCTGKDTMFRETALVIRPYYLGDFAGLDYQLLS